MMLHRELPIGFLDVLVGRVAIDAEYRVEIALSHRVRSRALSKLSLRTCKTAELRGAGGARFNSARYYVGGNHASIRPDAQRLPGDGISLLVFDFRKLGVDHLLVALLAAARGARLARVRRLR